VRVEWRDRDDVTRVKVPRECVGYITGSRGASLRETERKSGTFCFINDSDGKRGAESEDLLIFGYGCRLQPPPCFPSPPPALPSPG
jgi:hypothetical protein